MSRRDVIIIAVLLNAGLLAILFMMAINVEDDAIGDQMNATSSMAVEEVQSSPVQEEVSIAYSSEPVIDDLDNALKDFASTISPQNIVLDEENGETNDNLAPPEEKVTGTDEARYVDVSVKRGDALEKIARANGTTVEAIKKANDLNSEKLNIGQVLRVPVETKKAKETTPIAATKKKTETAVVSSDTEYYTIKSGDNPWKIAKQFRIKLEDLLKLNNLDEEKARNLKVGEKIKVK